ncbi:hypothetical protein J8F10_18185 [Gemmata sp. G18]|uniref:Uncharacterized protein n=1 Tax=Gemmata palustris TaxID=2822762 RepID=A0ABS5BTZ6_9BACT|nr:hypothetical protein [Gemmata palustris]MBP3957194.1 hypothetical protein [Gemmata palustris]
MPDRAALLIAVETFFEAGPLVQYAAADCAELLRALPAVGYAQERCTLLAAHRTTKAVIEATLKRLPKIVGDAESLLVLVASRGFNVKGRGYIACADTIVPDPLETALPVADLFAQLSKVKAKEITVLLDIDPLTIAESKLLHPGLDDAELAALLDKSPKCVGLLACAEGERSFESAQLRHGIWRHHLIEAFTGKTRSGVGKDGALTAAALHDFLADAVPRTLRRTYETAQEQTPTLYGEANGAVVVAELEKLLGPGGDLLDPTRMKRVVFRSESRGEVKNLTGYRKGQPIPDRANEWARKYVNRIATADIKADLDNTFDMVRETFGYKRKDLDVSAERDGLGFIRTPDFEYTVSLSVHEDDPSEVLWRREVSRLSGPDFVRGEGFRNVFGTMFDKLVFEFAVPVDVADFVDRIEDSPPEGVKVSVASDSGAAVIALTGFAGKVNVTRNAVTIEGHAGNPSSLMEQFLVFLRKFGGLGEPKALPSGG